MRAAELIPPPIDRTIALLPKNRGLAGQIAALRDRLADGTARFEVRGEDVPLLANEIARRGGSVTAFTGDDLLDEWLLAGNVLHERLVRRRVAWRDPLAAFGAPALCLIGSSPDLFERERPLRVAVCERYRLQTQRHLAAMRASGAQFDVLPIAGAVEACIGSGVADLIADIVVTGRTIAQSGLRVLRVISTSDVAVLETQP